MPFQKGHKIRNTGRTHFEKGVYQGFGFKKGHIPWHKGKNIQLNTGKTWFKKGNIISEKIKNKISNGLRMIYKNGGRKPIKMIGRENPNWKGDKVGYVALHTWVHRQLGKPHKCEKCEIEMTGKNMHWANKDHKYKRNLINWISLCRTCHRQYDKRLEGGIV